LPSAQLIVGVGCQQRRAANLTGLPTTCAHLQSGRCSIGRCRRPRLRVRETRGRPRTRPARLAAALRCGRSGTGVAAAADRVQSRRRRSPEGRGGLPTGRRSDRDAPGSPPAHRVTPVRRAGAPPVGLRGFSDRARDP